MRAVTNGKEYMSDILSDDETAITQHMDKLNQGFVINVPDES